MDARPERAAFGRPRAAREALASKIFEIRRNRYIASATCRRWSRHCADQRGFVGDRKCLEKLGLRRAPPDAHNSQENSKKSLLTYSAFPLQGRSP